MLNLLSNFTEISPMKEQVKALLEKSYLSRMNNLDNSIMLTQKALLLCDDEDDFELKAKAYYQLALYYMIIGNHEASTSNSIESLKLYESLNDELGIADVKYAMAGVYYKTNDYHLGLVYLVDSLNIYKKFNDYYNISRCEKSLGTIYDYFDDKKKAVISYENAISAAQLINDVVLESNAYNNLSGIYIKLGEIEKAHNLVEKSITIKKATNDIRGLAFALYGKGKVLLAQMNYVEAEANFKEAIAIHEQMGERLGLVMVQTKLAKLYVENNRLTEAIVLLKETLDIVNKYNVSIIKFKVYYLLYTIMKRQNNDTEALYYLELYLKEKEGVLNTQTLKVIDSYDMLVRMKMLQKDAELEKEKALMEEKNKRAEETARMRQEFLSTMSHEIRTPLNAVTTIVSMLNDDFGIYSKDLIEPLKFSTNHLMKIINDILDFTKLDLGKVKLDPQKVDIVSLLEHFKKTYQIHALRKDISFILRTDTLLEKKYMMDETKIIQILGNLVGNAIKFTDVGEVILDVSVVKQKENSDVLLFKVSDTGEGIEKDKIDLIFDSFSQIKNITTRKEGGTGLGLAIVKNLVTLHKSKIKVKSTYGKGSVFMFKIEFKKTQNSLDNDISDLTISSFVNKKLLLVEDNAINAFIAKTLISKWGIEVDHAINGGEAIEKAINTNYDYILMDIHMPGMDGFEATKIIRTTNDFNTTIPIFGLTADISAKDNAPNNTHFTGFLLKPLEIEKLKLALTNRR